MWNMMQCLRNRSPTLTELYQQKRYLIRLWNNSSCCSFEKYRSDTNSYFFYASNHRHCMFAVTQLRNRYKSEWKVTTEVSRVDSVILNVNFHPLMKGKINQNVHSGNHRLFTWSQWIKQEAVLSATPIKLDAKLRLGNGAPQIGSN